jgi:hypothetical protein
MGSRNPAGLAAIGAVGVVLALSVVLGLSPAPITLAGHTRGASASPPSTWPPETFANLNFVVSAGRSKPVGGATVMIDYNAGNGTERTMTAAASVILGFTIYATSSWAKKSGRRGDFLDAFMSWPFWCSTNEVTLPCLSLTKSKSPGMTVKKNLVSLSA